LTTEIETVKTNLLETKTNAAEIPDQEKRHNNVIIYRLPESTAHSPEERKREDTERVLELINNTLEVDCHVDDMKQVVRLRQRDRENTDRQKVSRPLLIKFKLYTTKTQLMESLYKLKNADDH